MFTDDDWLTPPTILAKLGKFDLDPCSPATRPWDTAGVHFTLENDGLKQPWFGRAWCNPPYSKINGKSQLGEWLKRMAALKNGMALTNVRCETGWFFDYVWNGATAVFFFEGRLKFYRPDGTRGTTGTNASCIAAYSEADAQILCHAFKNNPEYSGKFIPLVIKLSADLKTTWRQLVRHLLKECGGTATLEQLYELATGHPKTASNPNFKAKIRQQVQAVGQRVGEATWQALLI